MATVTAKQIQVDIRNMLVGSTLASGVNGQVYYDGSRPKDSKKEDIIVVFTSGMTDQVQRGVVTVNIYVPDIQVVAGGPLIENMPRTLAISALAQTWVDSRKTYMSPYRFKLASAILVGYEPEIDQHFVHVRLGYELFNGS